MSRDADDHDLRRAFAPLRDAEPSAAARAGLRHALLQPQDDGRAAGRRWAPRTLRPLILAMIAVSVAGTATAAVTGGFSTTGLEASATTGTPAARSLSGLLHLFSLTRAALVQVQSGTAPGHGRAPSDPVRGTTVVRDGIAVDLAVDARRGLCFSARDVGARTGGTGCFRVDVSSDALPTLTGRDTKRAWLVAVVPDGVRDFRVRAADGRTATPAVDANVAVATISGADRISGMSWTDAQGGAHVRDIGRRPPGTSSRAVVLHLDHR